MFTFGFKEKLSIATRFILVANEQTTVTTNQRRPALPRRWVSHQIVQLRCRNHQHGFILFIIVGLNFKAEIATSWSFDKTNLSGSVNIEAMRPKNNLNEQKKAN